MSENYKKDFVDKYGELMYWKGALNFTKDSLSRALYSEQMIKVIKSIKGDDSLRQFYEEFTQREEDLSLNILEKRCNEKVDNWREGEK